MAKKNKKQAVEPEAVPEVTSKPLVNDLGLGIQVSLEKVIMHGSERLVVTVLLFKDDQIIAEDSASVRV